ncbi:MAG TPA: hypothetical protein VNB90_17035 [Cytophagaceae bacterium]|nr:hypothetical protein [Cytophagaceae bacterium]
MKINKTILVAALLLLTVVAFTAFKNDTKAGKSEYLTIYTESGDFTEVHISIDGKDFRKINLLSEYRSLKGFNPLINLIHDQERDGWELMGTPTHVPYRGDGSYGAGIMIFMQRPAKN